jgi:hypothetical protein
MRLVLRHTVPAHPQSARTPRFPCSGRAPLSVMLAAALASACSNDHPVGARASETAALTVKTQTQTGFRFEADMRFDVDLDSAVYIRGTGYSKTVAYHMAYSDSADVVRLVLAPSQAAGARSPERSGSGAWREIRSITYSSDRVGPEAVTLSGRAIDMSAHSVNDWAFAAIKAPAHRRSPHSVSMDERRRVLRKWMANYVRLRPGAHAGSTFVDSTTASQGVSAGRSEWRGLASGLEYSSVVEFRRMPRLRGPVLRASVSVSQVKAAGQYLP